MNTMTVVGNLTADPELRFTQTGKPVAHFTIASTPRRFVRETGTWVDGDTVFLRLMTHHGDGRLTFTPANLRYRPGTATPLELVAAHDVALRGWRRAEVEDLLKAARFTVVECLGTMSGDAWSPTSSDLVIVARRD